MRLPCGLRWAPGWRSRRESERGIPLGCTCSTWRGSRRRPSSRDGWTTPWRLPAGGAQLFLEIQHTDAPAGVRKPAVPEDVVREILALDEEAVRGLKAGMQEISRRLEKINTFKVLCQGALGRCPYQRGARRRTDDPSEFPPSRLGEPSDPIEVLPPLPGLPRSSGSAGIGSLPVFPAVAALPSVTRKSGVERNRCCETTGSSLCAETPPTIYSDACECMALKFLTHRRSVRAPQGSFFWH